MDHNPHLARSLYLSFYPMGIQSCIQWVLNHLSYVIKMALGWNINSFILSITTLTMQEVPKERVNSENSKW